MRVTTCITRHNIDIDWSGKRKSGHAVTEKKRNGGIFCVGFVLLFFFSTPGMKDAFVIVAFLWFSGLLVFLGFVVFLGFLASGVCLVTGSPYLGSFTHASLGSLTHLTHRHLKHWQILGLSRS